MDGENMKIPHICLGRLFGKVQKGLGKIINPLK